MADALDSARIKLKRANLHAGIARREARRFFGRQSDPSFDVKPHGEQSDGSIGSIVGCKIIVTEGWPDSRLTSLLASATRSPATLALTCRAAADVRHGLQVGRCLASYHQGH